MQVVVEYDQGGVDAFIAFADAFEEEFDGIHVDGVQASEQQGFAAGAAAAAASAASGADGARGLCRCGPMTHSLARSHAARRWRAGRASLTSSTRTGSCCSAAAAPACQTTAICLMGCGKRGSRRRRPSAALYKTSLV